MTYPIYTTDWVTRKTENWRRHVGHLSGQPNVTGLEIGIYEGRSTQFWLDEICTHQTSRLLACDQSLKLFASNQEWFERTYQERLRVWRKDQVRFLMDLPINSRFDFAYLDGSKDPRTVLISACELWPHMRPGGVVIFDDYLWQRAAIQPKRGIDAFLTLVDGEFELVESDWQIAIKRN